MKNPLTPWRRSLPLRFSQHPFAATETLFDRFLDEFRKGWNLPISMNPDWENWQLEPSVDIVETEDCFKVEAEVPGMGPEDFKISIADRILRIQGEKTTSRKDKNKQYQRREIAYGIYQREIALPESVDITQAKASFKKGMLWVEIPKKAGAVSGYQEIAVEAAG